MNPRSHRLVYLAVVVALVIGVGAGFAAHSLTSSKSPAVVFPAVTHPTSPVSSTTTSSTDSLTQIYAKDTPGIVTVTVDGKAASSSSTNPFGVPGQQQFEAIGTGFEIDTNGNIMTAEHVVSGASKITVTFQDGSTAKATLVGKPDKTTDTAVIHVDKPASQLHPLTLGNSSAVLPGQTVVAIGSPFSLQETMTAGIVSAINRTITAPNNFSIPGAIQTDAAINHGNSGGPLIDAATNTVIGINDQILNAGDTNDNAGVGFAVPIDKSKAVANTLIAGGTVEHAYVGVLIQSVDGGAKVTKIVAGSPASKSGLKVGDVITSFDGHKVTSATDLTAAVSAAKVGDKVTFTVQRGGSTQQLSLTLGVQPASATS